MHRWFVRGVVAALPAVLLTTVTAVPAQAYKPYTHNWTADKAWDDAVDDCEVSVEGAGELPVIPEVCASIEEFPAHYNAGVIGPDGFPDLTFGQSVIHPEQTGKWVRHLHDAAWTQWAADPWSTESKQIMAFTYGYLTHAAGDLWAHTLVNTFADGVFPGVFDIVDEVSGGGPFNGNGETDLVEIALRHIIVEGYIGDATPGYDGNDDRTLVPGEVNEDGDPQVSDDRTPGTDFAVPSGFLYDTLVNPNNPLPVGRCGDGQDDDADGTADDGCPGGPYTVGEEPEPQRGPLIDHFLDLQADLQVKKAEFEIDQAFGDCADVDPDCYTVGESDEDGAGAPETRQVQTVRGVRTASVDVQRCIGAATGLCAPSLIDVADDLVINEVGAAYLGAWIDDITTGLQAWPRLGLELTNLLFDADTYREAQDFTCRNGIVDDDEHTNIDGGTRASCEDGVGFSQVLLYALADGGPGQTTFLTDHLLSMAGAPDFVGDGFEIVGDAATFLQTVLQTIMPEFDVLADLKEYVKDLLLDAVSEALGFDVETLFTFLKHPTYWLDQGSASLSLPIAGQQGVDLFPADAREKLDELMGLEDPLVGGREVELPDGTIALASALRDSAEWDVSEFDIAHNAIQLSKLVLVDGDALNSAVKAHGVAAGTLKSSAVVKTWTDQPGKPANVMIDPLAGTDPWLTSIDADHGWRQDAQPINVPRDPGVLHGGNGQFPLWESCLGRPAFRTLFRDWEPDTAGPGGTDANFGDLGDATSTDPSAAAAATSIGYAGATAEVGGVRYLGVDHEITVGAVDPVFTDANVTLRYRTYPAGGPVPSTWLSAPGPSTTFSLPAEYTDGPHVIEYQATNPCRPLAPTGTTATVVVDETPPTVTITSPASGTVLDVIGTSPVTGTATDAGSGVKAGSQTFALDGAPVTLPFTIDAFTMTAGIHTVTSSASDNVGNVGSDSNAFEVRPTSAGILAALARARSEGLISSAAVYSGLRDSASAAVRSHDRGQHATEWNQLSAVSTQLAGQSGKGVQTAFAGRARQWIAYLVAQGG